MALGHFLNQLFCSRKRYSRSCTEIIFVLHNGDVTWAYQITDNSAVWSTACSDQQQRKHQSSASPAILRWPVDSPHKRSVMRKNGPMLWRHYTHCRIQYHITINWNTIQYKLISECIDGQLKWLYWNYFIIFHKRNGVLCAENINIWYDIA